MNNDTKSSLDNAHAWLAGVPPQAQAAFEALATMQLLQEAADNAQAVIEATVKLPPDPVLAQHMHALACTTTTRLIDVAQRQITTLRALLQV